jgi:tetratricopeptide (TPR) repeat protein
LTTAKGPGDIHLRREKDPPELYFKSGLEYYKNHDFENALKNFKFASEKDIKPEYLLWIGKTYRQLDRQVQMFTIMERILKDYSESEVADDALFEMAFYYQKSDNYHKSIEKYRQLTEQYPYGLSYSNREEFMEVARKQLRMMRGEMISTLKLLGFEGETLSDAYKMFQKANNLEVTGEGDVITIKAIKEAYRNKLHEEERHAASISQLKRSVKWAAVFGAVLLINFVIMIIIRAKVVRNRKHLALLKETLSSLQ